MNNFLNIIAFLFITQTIFSSSDVKPLPVVANLHTQLQQAQTKSEIKAVQEKLHKTILFYSEQEKLLQNKNTQIVAQRRQLIEQRDQHTLAQTMRMYQTNPSTCYYQKTINLSEEGRKNLFQFLRAKAALEKDPNNEYWQAEKKAHDFLISDELKVIYRTDKVKLFDLIAQCNKNLVFNERRLACFLQNKKYLNFFQDIAEKKRYDLFVDVWQQLIAKKVDQHKVSVQNVENIVEGVVQNAWSEITIRQEIAIKKQQEELQRLALRNAAIASVVDSLFDKSWNQIKDREEKAIKKQQEEQRKQNQRQTSLVKIRIQQRNQEVLLQKKAKDAEMLDQYVAEQKILEQSKHIACLHALSVSTAHDEQEELERWRIYLKSLQEHNIKNLKIIPALQDYDKQYKTFEDQYSAAAVLAQRLQDLLELPLELHLEQLQYFFDVAYHMDKRLQQEGNVLAIYFDKIMYKRVLSEVVALGKELSSLQLSTLKAEWMQLYQQFLDAQARVDLLKQQEENQIDKIKKQYKKNSKSVKNIGIDQVIVHDKDLIGIQDKIAESQNNLLCIDTDIQAKKREINKFEVYSILQKIASLIKQYKIDPSLDYEKFGRLTQEQCAQYQQNIDNHIVNTLQNKEKVESIDIEPLLSSFIQDVQLERITGEDTVQVMANSLIKSCQQLVDGSLTLLFKQGLFEYMLNGDSSEESKHVIADVAKFQIMLMDSLIRHKKVKKKF